MPLEVPEGESFACELLISQLSDFQERDMNQGAAYILNMLFCVLSVGEA